MSESIIKITFTSDLEVGTELGFDVHHDGGPFGFPSSSPQIFHWVNIRSSSHQVTKGTPTSIIGERTAMNFKSAFDLDTGESYVVTREDNSVTIKALNTSFGIITFHVNGYFANYTNHPSVIFEINNGSSTVFEIDSITFSESTTPCTHVLATVTTSELATTIIEPDLGTNANNPFTFEVERAILSLVKCKNSNGSEAQQSFSTPPLLSIVNATIEIVDAPTGATVTVTMSNSDGLLLEYSLDNITWQSSNLFSGLANDYYTVYIKDQYGCNISVPFTINGTGINSPFFPIIPKSNSIRFANRVVWGDSGNYKNDENTLSCEANVIKPKKEIQQFQSSDVITTQFKSNYSEITATVIKEDLTEVDVPVLQKSENIGLKDRRDAKIFKVSDTQAGIYFGVGNIYDYDTGFDTGEDYVLNGARPEWGISGNYIVISGAWFVIEDVLYDDFRGVEYLLITKEYNSAIDSTIIAGSVYNKFNYEIYEFTIDMVDYLDQNIQVRINNNDDNFDNLVHLSEVLNIRVKQENTLEIRYKNPTNTDIFYSTGIEHLIRLPYQSKNSKIQDESELHKTDTTTILLNAELYEVDEFEFTPVTTEIMRKLTQALNHKILMIDGVGYVKNSIDVSDRQGDTNLYIVKAVLIKTGNVFNSQTSGNVDFSSSNSEIPNLIETENGFVNY